MSPFSHHVTEIKLRWFYFVSSTLCTFLTCSFFQPELFYFVGKPFLPFHHTFVFLGLTEAFYTLLKISALVTVLLMCPFILYHLWCFLVPSLYQRERSTLTHFILLVLGVFTCELVCIYLVVLPKMCDFFLRFQITPHLYPFTVELTAQIQSYVSLLITCVSSVLGLCQLPLIVSLFYWNGWLQVSLLWTNRKFLFVVALVCSAVCVPPEIVSQLVVALVFSVFLEILILVGLFFQQNTKTLSAMSLK